MPPITQWGRPPMQHTFFLDGSPLFREQRSVASSAIGQCCDIRHTKLQITLQPLAPNRLFGPRTESAIQNHEMAVTRARDAG